MLKTKMSLLSLVFLTGVASEAARTINITMPAGAKDLLLSNPSTASVSYDVVCYNKLGTATLNSTGQTLASNASSNHETGFADSGLCASAATPIYNYTDKNGKKVYYCSGSNTYANAGNLCGAGQKFCMPVSQFAGCSTYVGSYNVWVKSEAGTEFSNGGCTYSAVTVGTDYFYGGACGAFFYRKTGAGPEYLNGLSQTANASESHGASCCEDTSAGGICKVTINTAGNVFLSSPAFKGGSPF